MAARHRGASPRRLVALFLALTLAPATLLVGVGWVLFQQDGAALQQLQERREQAADLVVAALERELSATEAVLRDRSRQAGVATAADAVVVRLGSGGIESLPADRLAYSPPAISAGVSESPASDASGPAADLLSQAQGLTRQRRYAEALAVYDRLATAKRAAVAGLPAEMFAAWARCRLLAEHGSTRQLQHEAVIFRDRLRNGRWPVSRAAYDSNLADARGWTGDANPTPPTSAEVLAAAVEALWADWQRHDAGSAVAAPDRRRTLLVGDEAITLLRVAEADGLTVLVARPSFVDREWTTRLASLAERQGVRVSVRSPAMRGPVPNGTRRDIAETGLPWAVTVTAADPAGDLARASQRRLIWLAGLGAVMLLVIAGVYAVTRAVARELAVARLQSDFVAAVSHEFRTPLTSLRQLTEILIDERVTSDERRAAYYRALGRQTDRLHRLVEGLLDFGRMEAGTSPYRLEPLDACALVRSVVEEFERDAAGRGFKIDLDVDGTSAMVAGDRDALTNALWNLLDNAVKYSPASRTVWVSVEQDRSRLRIRVRDEGLGIPAGEHRAIFDKFVRGATAKAERIKGTGIGLAMVEHIVKAHGGDVRVESAVGAGSTFTIALPVVS